MKYLKVKFTRDGVPRGAAYTYKSDDDLSVGDKVTMSSGKHGIVVDESVDMEWVEKFGAENIKSVSKFVESEEK